MKLMLAFMLLFTLNLSASSFGQGRVNLRAKKVPIAEVLASIEQQTSYRFLYNNDLPALKNKITINAKEAGITDVLDQLLMGTSLTYSHMPDRLIVIKDDPLKKKDLTVTGMVIDDKGSPVPNASVQVKGSAIGTVTDSSGSFTLTVPDANAILVFSSVGYNEKEEALNGRTEIAVVLTTSSQSLEQVVVIGYGTQKKRDLTGTITSVKGEDIAKLPNTNPMSSLQGKVAGLTIVNSGRAGSSPTVRIRGVNSTSNTDPLYVVDGVFQTNIDYLNPGDIESMEILRDPSSIAIFGLQGGNGVIIVTTKRAARGQTRISFQSSVGVQKVINKIDLTDAEGFKKLYNMQLQNLGAAAFDYKNYTANTDWQSLIFQDAMINNNTLSIANSGEKTTTLFSLGYNVQEGVLKYDNYKKLIARLNQEIRITDNIKVGGDVTGFYWKQNSPSDEVFNYALRAAPIVPVQAGDDLYYSMPGFQRAQIANPVARINQTNGNSLKDGYRAVGNIFGEIKFLKNFTWRSSFYTDLGFNNTRGYTPLPYRYINLGEGVSKTDTSFNDLARTSVNQEQIQYRKFQQDHTLTFAKTVEKHTITALAGFTTLFQGNAKVGGSRTDTTLNIPRDPDYWYLDIVNPNNPLSNVGNGSEEAFMSLFARVNYAFDNRYLVNLSYRRDGSSKFSKANRWGDFGSIGLGWVISEENFFKNISGINFLKLRGAWGTVGSGMGLAPNLYLPGLTNRNSGIFGDRIYPGVTPEYVPDPNLHWEVVRGIDVGIDARLLDNRLSPEITFYDRTTKDIITNLTLPGTAGNYTYKTNLGTISNRGIEVALSWRDKIGDFTYGLSANYSYNKNKVTSIGDNINFEIIGNGGTNRTTTGESIGYFYGYRQIGIYQVTADFDRMASFPTSRVGDIAFEDVDNNGILDSKDRTYLGTPFPPHNFGASINLGYKGFDFMIDGQGVAGNKVYTQRRTAIFAPLNYESNRLGAWTGPGSTNIEPILDNTRGNNYVFSNYFLEPGDYFRIRTLQVGYTFSQKLLQKASIKQLRVYVSGQNIATFSKTTGYTPEAPLNDPIASGSDNGLFPTPAVYSFGLNVTF
ncbi:TonB-dependent receptor [Niabella aquatica]